MPEESPTSALVSEMSAEMQEMAKRHWDKIRFCYILDSENNAIKCNNRTFYCWMMVAGEDRRIVKHTYVGKILVSTVFLGKDQSYSHCADSPPMLFETYVFDGLEKGTKDRYSTWKEAEEGHAIAVRSVQECN